ncbi:MAG: hypothetical protein KKE37_09095 [Verrucomicrobia bacterium]|nr:hypothetical protein [Verrucomicrobiota bacterium]MBU4247124.1 hypothetical protein [Verrucomicrobiota bacterium]MBU4429491.1 hypothetical protein [Verrucomicrobiota bacterium]MCG2680595.1 hypothetical protein [Kiritimatiellia bacterium]
MRMVKIGKATISGLCIGGNPFSGFSHQGEKKSKEMIEYYTPDRIKQTLKEAEQAGVNTFFGRTDDHILGIVKDYRDQGSAIQWFAQVCEDSGDPGSWRKWLKASIDIGATGAYLHGGIVDYWYANKMFDCFKEALDIMRKADIVAGFAGHNPAAHQWICDNLELDFQMCSHYNPTDRSKSPHHISVGEKWNDEDRALIIKTIARVQKPVVHYKVFAGGNKSIVPAFAFLGNVVRPQDIVLVGVFTKDNPNMINEDVALFEKYIDKT